MFRNLSLLVACQALMLSATSLAMTSSALAGLTVAPVRSMATVPLGLCYVTVMLSLIPVSMLMQRHGRRAGFSLGALAGIIAGVLGAWSLYSGSFLLFSVSAVFQGLAMATAQFYRFAAAEAATESYRNRAISWVLAGGLVAAFMGPSIARFTRESLDLPLFTVSFGFIGILSLGVLLCVVFLDLPRPRATMSDGQARPLRTILVLPAFVTAVACAAIAYTTMNLLMTSTPLAMQVATLDFDQIAIVIQWHIVGMFAPSFFTGNLIDRFGVLRVMSAGVAMLVVCVVTSLSGQGYGSFLAALVCLGIGWNFLYVGGTSLLTRVYRPEERGLVQGINDFLVFFGVATTAMLSGFMHYHLGWSVLNLSVVPALLLAAALIAWMALGERRQLAAIRPE